MTENTDHENTNQENLDHNNIYAERLASLRLHMQEQQIDAFIAMSADPHMSEYLPEYWQVRLWLTGFTGSVGIVMVTQDFAGLWVDARYWV